MQNRLRYVFTNFLLFSKLIPIQNDFQQEISGAVIELTPALLKPIRLGGLVNIVKEGQIQNDEQA